MAMGGLKRVETINSKGCSRLFVGFSSSIPSFRTFQSFDLMSPSPTTSHGSELSTMVRSLGPFSGLVICVTGLSKEAKKQVMEATERLGGQYSTSLHPQCTHLVFEHVLKHRSRNGLFVVTIGWFVDSVKSNIRLSESVYTVKGIGECSPRVDELNLHVGSTDNSCLPSGFHETKKIKTIKNLQLRSSDRISDKCMDSTLSGHTLYIDSNISGELWNKVLEVVSKEGAATIDRWFVGCGVSLVVCEESSVHQYIGHSSNVVTPLWVLKTAKDRNLLRLVRVSVDLATQIGTVLETSRNHNAAKVMQNTESLKRNASHEERQQTVHLAKTRIQNRRNCHMQTSQTPIHPISPSTLLDSICWWISKPTSSARIYTESFSGDEDSDHRSIFFDANGDGKNSGGSFMDLTRLLTESERNELILENQFLTILFLVDRFLEMGPSSRTYFSHNGFTCLQVLDYIYEFYQENMSAYEIESAIHTDSRHADRLRAAYSSKEAVECGYVIFKRIDFLGSRKSFEMLKRVSWDNNSIVYELLLRA
ncbi:BRCT domain-containing DNA repair protein [Gossypium australe]|uniref:BRCT domain-containing DNA repair protein n=1 Tax=Gossypium australe TaxID=47621 RepID=A0A5B6VG73_9ROSI|nr:BRCT domain-containing DNA repair protein [Gossypium australe]